MYVIKNTSSAGDLFREIVGSSKMLKNFQNQRFLGVYMLFLRLFELFAAVEAFFGTLHLDFPLYGQHKVSAVIVRILGLYLIISYFRFSINY